MKSGILFFFLGFGLPFLDCAILSSKKNDYTQYLSDLNKSLFFRAKLTSLESELDQLETEQKAGQGILDTDKVRFMLNL